VESPNLDPKPDFWNIIATEFPRYEADWLLADKPPIEDWLLDQQAPEVAAENSEVNELMREMRIDNASSDERIIEYFLEVDGSFSSEEALRAALERDYGVSEEEADEAMHRALGQIEDVVSFDDPEEMNDYGYET